MRSTEDAVMLDAKQMESLFPDAVHIREKVLGFTKSLIVIRKSHYLYQRARSETREGRRAACGGAIVYHLAGRGSGAMGPDPR